MRRLLELIDRTATAHPRRVLAGLAIVTVVLGAAATRLQMEADLTAFVDEGSELVVALDRVRSELGGGGEAVQLLVDAGPGGEVLDADGVRAVAAIEQRAIEVLGDRVRIGSAGQAVTRSLAGFVADALDDRGGSLATATDAEVATVIDELVAGEPQLRRFVSVDADLGVPRARAALVVIELDAGLDDAEVVAAARDLGSVAAPDPDGGAAPGDATVVVFSNALMADGLQSEIGRELPALLGLALAAVIAVLAVVLRTWRDVAVGLVGLVVVVVWTLGLVAVLGPGMLGLRGPFTQVSTVVPVLLVGLGIDSTVHLTARYRRERAGGGAPVVAAGRSVRTVGAALVLATAATALGFAVGGAAPLQIVADVGIFTAVGVVCAFVVMVMLVTAVNAMQDPDRPLPTGVLAARAEPRWSRAPVAVATRAPRVALATAAVVVAAALVASTDLETTFARGDFVPADSDVGRTLTAVDELFGGDLTETTFVLVEGDLADPAVLAAMLDAQRALAAVGDVRVVAGEAQARSIAGLVRTAVRELTGDPTAGLDAIPGGIDDLRPWLDQLRDIAGAEVVDELVTPDADLGVVRIATTAGAGTAAEELRDAVVGAFEPVERAGTTVTVTSEQLILAELATELRSFQSRSIVLALVSVLALLAAYYGWVRRRLVLGVVAMTPAAFSASMLLGSMWVLGISFNPVTATITAISIGIGVPFGIHLVNRFTEALDGGLEPDAACRATLDAIGGALVGSALTTLVAFVVLSTSGLVPLRQLGLLGAMSIAFALLAALWVEPAALVVWARRSARRPANRGTGFAAGRSG